MIHWNRKHMPYDTIAEMQKKIPAMRSLTPAQMKVAMEVFNSSIKSGDSESAAIAKAIAAAKRAKLSEESTRLMTLAQVSDQDIDGTEFEILKVGDYYDQRYGKFSITLEKLNSLKRNFDENVLEIDVALDANHEPEGGAYAWIKALRVSGDTLLMSLKDVTARGREALRDKVFKYFSVEFAPFTKVEDGKKVTISDVLRGVALTNRPVIKGMAATFFSETANKLFITSNMSVFKKFAEAKVAAGKVSAEDAKLAKAMFDEMSAEEQEAEKPALESVEAEAAKTAEAEAGEKAEAEKAELEAKAKEEAPKEEPKAEEPEAVAAAELSEVQAKYAESQAKLADMVAKEAARTLSENVARLTLSDKNTRGFAKAHVPALSEFVGSLDDAQFAKFSDLMGKFVTVNTKEIGSGIDGATLNDAKIKVGESSFDVSGADVDMEIKSLAASEKISYFDAARKYAEARKS